MCANVRKCASLSLISSAPPPLKEPCVGQFLWHQKKFSRTGTNSPHATKCCSALRPPIGLRRKTVFTDANRQISIRRSHLLSAREGMQGSERPNGPLKPMNDKNSLVRSAFKDNSALLQLWSHFTSFGHHFYWLWKHCTKNNCSGKTATSLQWNLIRQDTQVVSKMSITIPHCTGKQRALLGPQNHAKYGMSKV